MVRLLRTFKKWTHRSWTVFKRGHIGPQTPKAWYVRNKAKSIFNFLPYNHSKFTLVVWPVFCTESGTLKRRHFKSGWNVTNLTSLLSSSVQSQKKIIKIGSTILFIEIRFTILHLNWCTSTISVDCHLWYPVSFRIRTSSTNLTWYLVLYKNYKIARTSIWTLYTFFYFKASNKFDTTPHYLANSGEPEFKTRSWAFIIIIILSHYISCLFFFFFQAGYHLSSRLFFYYIQGWSLLLLLVLFIFQRA